MIRLIALDIDDTLVLSGKPVSEMIRLYYPGNLFPSVIAGRLQKRGKPASRLLLRREEDLPVLPRSENSFISMSR